MRTIILIGYFPEEYLYLSSVVPESITQECRLDESLDSACSHESHLSLLR